MSASVMSRPAVVVFDSADGWIMATVGPVKVTCVGKVLSEVSFTRLVSATARLIDDTPPDARNAILYDVPSPGDMDARRRKTIGDVLNARKDKLALITSSYVLVTGSPVVRGILTAVFWFAPPPYPWHVAPTPRDGVAWLARHTPERIDVAATVEAYLEIRRTIVPETVTRGVAP